MQKVNTTEEFIDPVRLVPQPVGYEDKLPIEKGPTSAKSDTSDEGTSKVSERARICSNAADVSRNLMPQNNKLPARW